MCPQDRLPVREAGGGLVCGHGHHYRVVEGVPIMLFPEEGERHRAELAALAEFEDEGGPGAATPPEGATVDPFVQEVIVGTGGFLYASLAHRLPEYPIPALRLLPTTGPAFLDVGCNWGRWCIAAARAGFAPVGIDPEASAVFAARRVAAQLGVQARFVVGDGRYLPFSDDTFDVVFSYSVLQHLSRDGVRRALPEIRRVLKTGGRAVVEMPHRLGLRALYHQAQRGFREAHGWEVRYWSLSDLRATFGQAIGPANLVVDGYFSLNPQVSDLHLLRWHHRWIVRASEALRRLSEVLPALIYAADSVFVLATKDVRTASSG